MQDKKSKRGSAASQGQDHRKVVRFEELLEDDRFDDEDADSVTEDTLEFLSLDDDMIDSYQRTHAPKDGKASSGKIAPAKQSAHVVEVYDEEDEYEDDDYEDEDYEDDDYEDDYEYDDEDGFAARLMYFIGEMSGLDVAVAVLGILVLVGAFVTGGIYVHAKSMEKQVAAFASVGEEIEGISVIGESGLIAVAESARLGGMIDVPEETPEEQEEAAPEESKGEVEVSLHLTSILSDMKIKFVNKETGKLIGGVPFEVEVSGTKSFNLKDEDKDGVIYQTGVAAGTYDVKILPLTGAAAEKYKLPSAAGSVKVTDKIAYQKVDVADEVKTEAEVNVAKEEATQQNTVQESALTDTVEWVESTKTPIGEETAEYEKVSADKITDPWTSSSAFRKMVFDNVTVSLDKYSLTLDKGNSESLNVFVGDGSVEYSVVWSAADSSIATVSDGTVTAVAPGETEVKARVVVGGTSQEIVCSVTVKDSGEKDSDNKDGQGEGNSDQDKNESGEVVYKKISISGPGEVAVGKTVTLSAQTDPQGGKINWSSEDEKVAKVDGNGVVTGVAEGEVKIRALCKSSEDITETFKIKVVKEAAVVDGSTKLKDKDGNQLYYKNSKGEYKEATYQDYRERDTFYKKVKSSSAYKYTGWQTIDGHVYFYDKDGNYVTGDQVIQGARYSFGSDGKLAKSSGTMGIDVSKHNGNIDWNAVKNSGVSYVIIRCGYRGYSTGVLVEDPKFRSNIKGAKAAGLKVGAYFFSQAVNEVEAVEEASMAIDLVKGYGLNYPLFLDVEGSGGRADGISRDTRTAVCKAFCQTVQNSGISAGVYANKNWFTEKINTASLTSYKLWLAQYAGTPTYTATRYDLWQYSSTGKVSGISTNVDMNISYVNY